MQTPVIIVIGPPHHGKTEARKLLSEITHLKGESTSTIIYHYLAQRRGVSVDSLKSLPKEELRPTLIKAGDFLVDAGPPLEEPSKHATIDADMYRVPSALVRTLYLSGYNIIDGVRRRRELEDAINHLDWAGVRSLVLWVERPGHSTVSDNTELTQADAKHVILNDGTLPDLRAKLFAALELEYGKQDKLQKPIPVVDAPQA